MATPGQLVQTMAEALGIPAETVTNYDRVLSENGMRSKSGRGRGAAKVTAGDAANLFIAIMGSPIAGASVKEAANSCHTYGSLPRLGHVSGTIKFADIGLPMIDELPKEHTLHDAIAALINSAAKGERCGISCRIEFQGPRPWAGIIAYPWNKESRSVEPRKFARLVYTHHRQRKSDIEPSLKGLLQNRSTSYGTIREIGSLLAKEKDDEAKEPKLA